MELRETLRTTAAVREFTDEPVSDEALQAILDTARFAPSGGNRQGWRVVVVKDADTRRALRDLYLPTWYEYVAQGAEGLVAWAPITDRDAEERAVARAPEYAEKAAAGPGGFAEHFDEIPVLLVVLVDMRSLAAIDRDLDRYSFVGGASIYPFAWSLLLAAREEGLGGVLTTVLVKKEAEVLRLLGVPDEYALAAVVGLGHPAKRVTRLRRESVERFVTVDRFDGEPLGGTH